MPISRHIPEHIISIVNSTTTPLAGGATFTGQWELIDKSKVLVSGYSDVSGTLYFDFSINGVDARTFPTNGFKVTGAIHEFHIAEKGYRYFRVRYVNDSIAQSTFQLQIQYSNYFDRPNAPINQSLALDSDSTVIRNPYSNVEAGLGKITGVDATESPKSGYNPSFTSASGEITLWGTATRWTPMSSASVLTVVSSSANDTAAGTGGRTLKIVGSDANGLRQEETVTLNGTTNVLTTKTFKCVNRAELVTAGSGNVNAGNITITGGTQQGYITAGAGKTEQLFYTSYADEIVLINGIRLNIAKTAGGAFPVLTINIYKRLANGVIHRLAPARIDTNVKNEYEHGFAETNKSIKAGESIEVTVSADTGTGISVGGSMYYTRYSVI